MDLKWEAKREIISNFINICKANNIWYSLDNFTLLSLKQGVASIGYNSKFQVLMTVFSYEKLARLFPKQTFDSSSDPKIESYKAFFVQEKNAQKEEKFIEIRILIPTTIKKVYRFRKSLKNIFKRNWNLKLAINKLNERKYEGFYVLDKGKKVVELWIPNISFEMEKGNFIDLEVQYVKEWKDMLINQFGKNYMKIIPIQKKG